MRTREVVSALLLFTALASLGSNGCGAPSPEENLGESAAALNANDKIAFDYFLGKGLTPTQTAGIIGNLDVESGMDPKAAQPGGPGRGIAQWSAGARWDTTAGDNVKAYAASHGADPLSLGLQLDFIWFELTTFSTYGLAKLRAATTVSQAVSAFQGAFEGCSACDSSARVTDAQKALAAYGSDVPADGGGGGGGGDAGVSCVVTTTGTAGECITTTECSALGNHVSTPGYCPGSSDVQCCTALDVTGDAGGTGSDGSSGGGGGKNGGNGNDASADSGGGCSTTNAPGGEGTSLLLLAGALLLGSTVRRARTRRRDRVSPHPIE